VMMTAKTVGCIIGPFLISFLSVFTENYRIYLWAGFIPVVAAFIILWRYMSDTPDVIEKNPKQDKELERSKSQISWQDIKQLPTAYWLLLITATIFMFARFSDGFLALRLQDLGTPAWIYLATIGIFNFISALCSYPIGYLSDKIGRTKLLYFSYIALIASNLCFFMADSMWLGLLGVLFWGAQRGSSQILFTAIVADVVPKKIIGTAIGLFYIVFGIVSLATSSIAGKLADKLSNVFVFGLIVSTLALLSLWFMSVFMSRKKRHNAPFMNTSPILSK